MAGGVLTTSGPSSSNETRGIWQRGARRARDPRVWFGLLVTVVAMWFALRGVDLGLVAAEFARADLVVLLGLSIPSYLAVVWLRALRWRHLTNPIQEMPRGALFRAVSVGFLANNIFPLRMGEFVRSWYLGRECGTSPAAVFGTVILERVIDTLIVILLAFAMFSIHGGGDDGAWRRGVLLLLPVAVLPVLAIVWIRLAPDQVMGIVLGLSRPLPEAWRDFLARQLHRFGDGLGAVSGGSHLFWIVFHSLLIWLVASTIPILGAFVALEVDFGSPLSTLMAAWTTLSAVGIAVALPSAPGFFGVYHSACRLVLERFGMSPEMAVALGTLIHAVFWVTLTALGLLVLRMRRTPLADLDRAADANEPR